jgi:LmbE family N-acetylglucosaminyl deacetylase
MDLDVLAFSPHPDDAELGCGGSLILAADSGLKVAVADLSAGEMSSRGTPDQRRSEKEEAADRLGLCTRTLVGLPDGEIGTDPAHRLAIIQLIRETRPRIVLAPYGQDRHPDHAGASKLVKDACMIHHPFTPSLVVDVSSVWDRKMAAVAAYRSQFQPDGGGVQTAISRPDFLRFVEARAIVFGAMIGVAYGEAFYLPGPVPLGGLPGLTGPAPARGELPSYRTY